DSAPSGSTAPGSRRSTTSRATRRSSPAWRMSPRTWLSPRADGALHLAHASLAAPHLSEQEPIDAHLFLEHGPDRGDDQHGRAGRPVDLATGGPGPGAADRCVEER